MAKKISKEEMYEMNTIATKLFDSHLKRLERHNNLGMAEFELKTIKRIKYLKICWNCECAYESGKYNSYACCKRCSWNINYKLKRGIAPPANMAFKTKAKNIKPILAEFGYI